MSKPPPARDRDKKLDERKTAPCPVCAQPVTLGKARFIRCRSEMCKKRLLFRASAETGRPGDHWRRKNA